jgi:hypothetical protein
LTGQQAGNFKVIWIKRQSKKKLPNARANAIVTAALAKHDKCPHGIKIKTEKIMNKKIATMGFAATMLFAVNCKPKAAAGAEAGKSVKWDCKFTGDYKEKSGGTGKFTWNVMWVESEATSTLSGTGKDEGGESTTTGTCDKNSCKVQETYTSGPMKGKTGYWAFTYQDAETKSETVYVTTFQGTFGPSEADRASLGTLSAKADCKAAQ